MGNDKYIYRNTFRLTNNDVDLAYYEIITRLIREKGISFNALVKLALVELDKQNTKETIITEVNNIINEKLDEYFNTQQITKEIVKDELNKEESTIPDVDADTDDNGSEDVMLQNMVDMLGGLGLMES